jgi:hypothetical protein
MPLGANYNLGDLYARQRLVEGEAARLEAELAHLHRGGQDQDRQYLLGVQIRALGEEATKLGSSISDVLDRDLQR